MSIVENAMSAIRLGLADFASGEDERLLSALRNLHAGILLLYKAKLSSLSPAGSDDVLIKKKILPKLTPDRTITFVGAGRRTVDVAEIRERFNALNIETNWAAFDRINRTRNEVEHYFTTTHRDTFRAMISDTFIIVRDFSTQELGLDPMDELGQEAWNILISVAAVMDKERRECGFKIASLDWGSADLESAVTRIRCSDCGSPLIAPSGATREDGITCRSCGEFEGFEPLAERALRECLGPRNASARYDGRDEELVQCPFCFHETYVVDEHACAVCGESCAQTCDFCSSDIPVCELSDSSNCSWCDHMLSKDD